MSTQRKPLTPEQQIKVLQIELQQANEKARLFEAMLDVLKQDYGVRVAQLVEDVKSVDASGLTVDGTPPAEK